MVKAARAQRTARSRISSPPTRYPRGLEAACQLPGSVSEAQSASICWPDVSLAMCMHYLAHPRSSTLPDFAHVN